MHPLHGLLGSFGSRLRYLAAERLLHAELSREQLPGQGGLGGGILGKDGKFDNPLGKGGDKTGQIITGKSPGELSTGSQKDAKDVKDPKGQMLDVPLGTLKSRLHRTRAELKKSLRLEPSAPPERVRDHEMP